MRTVHCSGHLSYHACPRPNMHTPLLTHAPATNPPPHMPPAMHVPLPCMPACHACPLPCMPHCHAHPLPCMPPCHACPLPCTPSTTHPPYACIRYHSKYPSGQERCNLLWVLGLDHRVVSPCTIVLHHTTTLLIRVSQLVDFAWASMSLLIPMWQIHNLRKKFK